jgi:hypothetical protein
MCLIWLFALFIWDESDDASLDLAGWEAEDESGRVAAMGASTSGRNLHQYSSE